MAVPWIQTRDGVDLFYRDWGSGRPVVFLHSLLMDGAMWQHQLLHLAEHGYRAIAFDRRGTADPTIPAADTTTTRSPATSPAY